MRDIGWVRSYYDVPAKRGMRVRLKEHGMRHMTGVIVGARDQYLRVRWDCLSFICTVHPLSVTYQRPTGPEGEQ